jgi:alkylation response protein AidB-like acyl-CoA dehydrogenase
MDFDLSQDQQMLFDTAAAFLRKESPITRLRAMREDPLGYSRPLWQRMGELGWLGLLFPESVGGLGGSFADGALILEQFGATLVPEPFIPSVVLAGMAILRAGDEAQQQRWLPGLIEGNTTLALAYAEPQSRFDVTRVATRAERTGGGYRIDGSKVFVLNGHGADTIVVSARTSGAEGDRTGISLFVVEPGAKGLGVRPIRTMDGHHAANLTFDNVQVDLDRRLGPEGDAAPVLDEVLDLGAAAACAEGAGIMRAVLQMTVEYLRTREQFGVKIGTFQALQHRAVDMFVETELARSTSILASLSVGRGSASAVPSSVGRGSASAVPSSVGRGGSERETNERKSAISAAKTQLAVSGRFVTQQAVQLHGGIGVTDEHDVGLYFKRMHILGTLFGDEEFHVSRFASLPTFTTVL